MSAADRRVLHVTLQNDKHATTKSVGEGMNRKVVVVPKRSSGGGRDGGRRNNNRGRTGNRQGGRRNQGNQGNSNVGNGKIQPLRRKSAKPTRMHDSFDVPPVPESDVLSDDVVELLAQGASLESLGIQQGGEE